VSGVAGIFDINTNVNVSFTSEKRLAGAGRKKYVDGSHITLPVVNFTNILRAAFSPIFWRQKFQSQASKFCNFLAPKNVGVKC